MTFGDLSRPHPNNAVNWLTQRNYGLSDAADLLVFISGYTTSCGMFPSVVAQADGNTVLDSGVEIEEGRHDYAHCLRGAPEGVTCLVIINSTTPAIIEMPHESKR